MEIKKDTFIPTRTVQAQSEIDQKLKDAAQMYEQHFLGEMVKAMRQSVSTSDLVESNMGQKIYEGQLDQQYVEQWSNAGGVGLSDLIYQNIKERYFPAHTMTRVAPGEVVPTQKNVEMYPIKNSDVGAPASAKALENLSGSNPATFGPSTHLKIKIDKTQSSNDVNSPAEGVVVSHAQLTGGFNQIVIDHLNGTTSQLLYSGQPTALSGQNVRTGQKIAQLNPQSTEVEWLLRSQPESKAA